MREHKRLSMADLKAGSVYLKRSPCGGKATVKKVLSFDNESVTYQWLHGKPRNLHSKPDILTQSRRHFSRWFLTSRSKTGAVVEVEEGVDYDKYKGAVRHETYLCLRANGQPLLRCSEKRAKFYLRKNYAVLIDDYTLRFTNEVTEKRLAEYCGEETLGKNPFFLSVKNDRCVVCGTDHWLTRHHVIPQRHKKSMPLAVRKTLSNVLFVCWPCHKKYEDVVGESEPLFDLSNPKNWRDHFIRTMKPEHMPKGWDIVIGSQIYRKEN